MAEFSFLAPIGLLMVVGIIVMAYLKYTERGDKIVSFNLSESQAQKLQSEADRLGVKPDDLARAAVADLLATRDEDFRAAAERVLKKNAELYERPA